MFTTSEKQKLLGLYKKSFKDFAFENFFSCIKFFKKSILAIFFMKQYFSIPNINLKWFQLSFDVYIVYIGQKLYIFKNFCPGSWKFCFVRWGYFGTLFWKKFESQYGFWSFHRRIIIPKVLWVHFWVGPQKSDIIGYG